jgi:hypothetical protein
MFMAKPCSEARLTSLLKNRLSDVWVFCAASAALPDVGHLAVGQLVLPEGGPPRSGGGTPQGCPSPGSSILKTVLAHARTFPKKYLKNT